MKQSSQRFLFDAPGTYRIRVRGRLAAHWSETFGRMTIRAMQRRGNPPVTTLTGELADQCSLLGVLNALYEMGYTLLDVKRLPDPLVPETEEPAATV